MELQQSLNDTKKEAADNERTLRHWQTEHDKLTLEDIECVSFRFSGKTPADPIRIIAMTKTMKKRDTKRHL